MGNLNNLIGETTPVRNANGDIEKTTDVIKCPSCGANMVFDPKKQALSCEHCGNVIDFTKDQCITERDFRYHERDIEDWSSETVVIRCNNCGAAEVVSRTEIAKICPFCGTSNIIETEELPGIKPNVVYPFTINKVCCSEYVRKWLKRKLFVPKAFKRNVEILNLHGIYHPAWTFDSNTVSNYSGTLGKYVTRTVGSGKNRHTVTTIDYFRVSGVYNFFFDDVLVEAGTAVDTKTFNKLRPFNNNIAVVYDKKYLAGFSAHHYEKNIDAAFVDAKHMMDAHIKRGIMDRYNADVDSNLSVNTYHNNVTFKYILFPVWLGCFNYKNRDYRFYVNGNSGKIIGKVPRNLTPLWITLGGIVAVGATLGIVNHFTGFLDPIFSGDSSGGNPTEYRIEHQEENNYELSGYRFKFGL